MPLFNLSGTFASLLGQSGMLRYEMSETGTSLAGAEKQAGLLWQMARQSVGQPIDWASSGCDLCLPFLSHLKGEVSGSDRVMCKSSTWLVTPRWALYLPSSLSSQADVVFDVKWLRGIYCAWLRSKKSSMNITTLSTLIRMKLLLALPLPWLNLTS